MKRFITFISSTFLITCVACGTQEDNGIVRPALPLEYDTEIDAALMPYVQGFIQDCEQRRTDCRKRLRLVKEVKVVPITHKQDNPDLITVGLCYKNLVASKVHISDEILKNSGYYIRAVVYHELGHCMYDLEHEGQDGRLMGEVMPSIFTIIQQWPTMVSELFDQAQERHGP
jgi:hypothetical protein